MTYYNTRKHIFETNFKNTQNNTHEFQFKHTKFNVLSQTSDDNYIYLDAISDTATCCCTACNSHNTFKKDKKVVYPLVGIYNNKPIIMRFTISKK